MLCSTAYGFCDHQLTATCLVLNLHPIPLPVSCLFTFAWRTGPFEHYLECQLHVGFWQLQEGQPQVGLDGAAYCRRMEVRTKVGVSVAKKMTRLASNFWADHWLFFGQSDEKIVREKQTLKLWGMNLFDTWVIFIAADFRFLFGGFSFEIMGESLTVTKTWSV